MSTIPNPTIITLTPNEMAIAQQVAANRNGVARTAGLINKKIGPQSCYETDLDGYVAELSFCKLKNVYPDLEGLPRAFDVRLHDGTTVEIRCTRRPGGGLFCRSAHGADLLALAILQADNVVLFPGYITRADALKCPASDPGEYGEPAILVPQRALTKWKEQLQWERDQQPQLLAGE